MIAVSYHRTSQDKFIEWWWCSIKNKFPNKIEKDFLVFLYEYHFLKYSDAKFLFNTSEYYRRQISDLLNNDYIKKHNTGTYILSDNGKRYLKSLGYDFGTKMAYSKKYIERQILISYIAAVFYNNSNINFIPSFKLKDKEIFTIKSRRYIGSIVINKKEYLTYYISKKQDKKYIDSVFYDIQKEKDYNNIIIFTEDISKIDLNQFCFGLKEVLIIENTLNNLVKINYINKVHWSRIIHNLYQNKVFISEYNFCDYTDKKNIFVSCFYFIDTEKINLLKYFLRENKDKKIDIICSRDLLDILKSEIPNQNYYLIDFDSFIKGEFNIYE